MSEHYSLYSLPFNISPLAPQISCVSPVTGSSLTYSDSLSLLCPPNTLQRALSCM